MARSTKKKGGCWGGGGCQGGRRRKMKGGATFSSFGGDQDVIGAPGGMRGAVNISRSVGLPTAGDPQPNDEGTYAAAGGRRSRRRTRRASRVVKKKSVKTLKRLLKAKGMKVSGSRRAITARARKARIPLKGGGSETGTPYLSYRGEGFAGRTSEFVAAHPVSGGVLNMPGYGSGGDAFRESGSGGTVSA